MRFKMIFFDLDGTLLPMDMDEFTNGYFRYLARKLMPRGYEAAPLVDAVWKGTYAMVKNDGSVTNEEAFWNTFSALLGEKVLADRPLFDEFYAVDFDCAKQFTGFDPLAAKVVRAAKQAGYRVALATNPIFPETATVKRTAWAGLDVNEFELFTVYENSRHCKPNPEYYRDLLRQTGLEASDCLMVGNDTREDIAAAKACGMEAFLITDCAINKDGADIGSMHHGGFEDLAAFLGISV